MRIHRHFPVLLFFFFLSSSAIFGQHPGKLLEKNAPRLSKVPKGSSMGDHEKRYGARSGARAADCKGDTVFYEDFKNGVSGNNAFGAWDTTGLKSEYWEHDMDGPDSLDIPQLESPTAGNGYMIYDLYGKISSGEKAEGYLTSPMLDLSSYPNARIEFHSDVAHCCSFEFDLLLEVSYDNGQSWSHTFNLTKDIPRNEYSGADMRYGFDLTDAIAATPDGVADSMKVRFSWVALSPDANNQLSNSYFMRVDDVVIKAPDQNDLQIGPTGYASSSRGIEYKMIPLSQRHPMRFGAKGCNIGSNKLTGVQVDVDVKDTSGSTVYNASSPADTLMPRTCFSDTTGDSTFAFATPSFKPNQKEWMIANYTLTSDSSDCDTSDNSGGKEYFRMTDEVYALDLYDLMGMTDVQEAPSDGSGGYKEFEAVNGFEFFEKDTIRSISFYADPNSTEDDAGPFVVEVRADRGDRGDGNALARSAPFYINNNSTCQDTGMITIPLEDILPVDSGDQYFAAVRYEGGSESFGIGLSGENNNGAYCSIYGDLGSAATGFYAVDEVPILRMNMGNLKTVDSSYTTGYETRTICAGDSALIAGEYRKKEGTYYDTISNITGCDSIIETTLSVDSIKTVYETRSICAGDSAFIAGEYRKKEDTYSDTTFNATGCDSVIETTLFVDTVNTDVSKSDNTLTSENSYATSYQWLDCDNGHSSIYGKTGKSFTPVTNGNYAVEVTESGCTDTSICHKVTGIGIRERGMNNAELSVHPNPSQGRVLLRSSGFGGEDKTLRIVDITGKVVMEKRTERLPRALDLNGLEDGIYILKVNTSETTLHQRLMLQRTEHP